MHMHTPKLGSGGWEKTPGRELVQLRRQRAVVVVVGGEGGSDVIPPTPVNLVVPATTLQLTATAQQPTAALALKPASFVLSFNRGRSRPEPESQPEPQPETETETEPEPPVVPTKW